MIQEPIILNYYEENDESVPEAVRALPKVTLKINPANLTINWKKIITRVRTKSRVVSLYWGQEPVNFSYVGQTGNLYPVEELQKKANVVSSTNSVTVEELRDTIVELTAKRAVVLEYIATADDDFTRDELLTELAELETELINSQSSIDNIQSGVVAIEKVSTHTEVLELSPKYQVWQSLQQLYDDSQNISDLLKVKYRDYIFEGYFENFGFTDDGSQPWERPYSLSFTVLNWDKKFSVGDKQL